MLGRMYDAIEYRGFARTIVESSRSGPACPVYNGLTDEWHPTQILADFLTMREHSRKPLARDRRSATSATRASTWATRYLIGGAKLGMDVRIASPKALWPRRTTSSTSRARSRPRRGATITITDDVARGGAAAATSIYTDVWVSMGEPSEVWERADRAARCPTR